MAGTERCCMHCSDMQVIIKAWSLAVISYDEIDEKGQTTHVMLIVTHTTANVLQPVTVLFRMKNEILTDQSCLAMTQGKHHLNTVQQDWQVLSGLQKSCIINHVTTTVKITTHPHTHKRLTAFFPGQPGTRRINHSGFCWSKRWRGGSDISWTTCKSFAIRSRQITTPAPHHSSAQSNN